MFIGRDLLEEYILSRLDGGHYMYSYLLHSYFNIPPEEVITMVDSINDVNRCRIDSGRFYFDKGMAEALRAWYKLEGSAYDELGFYNFMTALGL